MKLDTGKIAIDILTDSTSVPNALLDHYRELGLAENEVLFLIMLLRIKAKKTALNCKSVAKESAYTEEEVKGIVPALIDKGFLSLNADGVIETDGLVEKIMEVWSWNAVKAEQKIKKERKNAKEDKVFSSLYVRFEQEMGRPLSPIEGEQIGYWYHDQKIPAPLIEEGLKRAVLLGKYNFRYIEAMLFSWRRQGVNTLEELKTADQNRKSAMKKSGNNGSKNERSFRGKQEDIYTDDIYEVF